MIKKEKLEEMKAFYKGKKVIITGAHGFKGEWLRMLLVHFGANVHGIGLPNDDTTFSDALASHLIDKSINQVQDIRDVEKLKEVFFESQPDLVFHLAAQPIVSIGYKDPYTTFSSNVMGTVNVLEGLRNLNKKVSAVMVTTDKVYFDSNKREGYVEADLLLGRDPYSASKSAAEHVIYSYKKSFFDDSKFNDDGKIVSVARAGNVIGGGDFSANRLVPDLVRAAKAGKPVEIRNFEAIRPYEHVLDTVFAYALLGFIQYVNPMFASEYNIGPNSESLMKNNEVINYFSERLNLEIVDVSKNEKIHETEVLTLDSTSFRNVFDWSPKWSSKEEILSKTLGWYNESYILKNSSMYDYSMKQIRSFLK